MTQVELDRKAALRTLLEHYGIPASALADIFTAESAPVTPDMTYRWLGGDFSTFVTDEHRRPIMELLRVCVALEEHFGSVERSRLLGPNSAGVTLADLIRRRQWQVLDWYYNYLSDLVSKPAQISHQAA